MVIEKGFFTRMKKMKVISMLGMGMDLGELNDYSYEICFLLIQNIFNREIRENTNRTRKDMIFITEKILRDMNLEASIEIVERIVDGVLWYRNPEKQEPFLSLIYNEETRKKEDFLFRYFKVDRENSRWDRGESTVYMLTEESQEMIFITREILEEFGFNLEQFYTLQLIKKGNFKKAKNSIDSLIARVLVLIGREKEYKQDIIRNPQNIFFDRKILGNKTEQEIKEQFENEKEVFKNMFSWRDRYESLPGNEKTTATDMFDNLERARALHDELAKIVTENLALEMEIRVKYPESFWDISRFSFKKDIWQNNVVKNGLNAPEDFEKLVAPLFSPIAEFIYPLDWAWSEQLVRTKRVKEKTREYEIEEDWDFREMDWEIVTELYHGVFKSLVDKGRFSILELNNISENEKNKWLSQRENIDLFMMFVISDIILNYGYAASDERLKLFNLLCDKYPEFRVLEGKKISSLIDDTDEIFMWKEIFISPYIIYIKE